MSQKIPEDWRHLSEVSAARVQQTLKKEYVDVVLAADELFMRFHEASGSILAPTGEKQIGSTAKIDRKSGCTVLPTMDMTASKLLPPLVIFTGVFGARLMKKWQLYNCSLV